MPTGASFYHVSRAAADDPSCYGLAELCTCWHPGVTREMCPVSQGVLWYAGSTLSPWGRLSFVDLAGNERADRTGNTGQRMEESKAINKSLFNLQACLRELRWNQQNAADKEPRNVPYRASKVVARLSNYQSLAHRYSVHPSVTRCKVLTHTHVQVLPGPASLNSPEKRAILLTQPFG